jgi:hypothetical protein
VPKELNLRHRPFGTSDKLSDFFDFGDRWRGQYKKARSYPKDVPRWVFNDAAIEIVLQRSFPKMRFNEKQRDAAARWAMIINLYYRLRYTASQVAEEMGTTECRVQSVVRAIQRAVRNRQAGTNKPRSTYRRGKNPTSRRKPRKPRLFDSF